MITVQCLNRTIISNPLAIADHANIKKYNGLPHEALVFMAYTLRPSLKVHACASSGLDVLVLVGSSSIVCVCEQ